mgnify:CR=1 FL=1
MVWVGPVGEAHVIKKMQLGPGKDRWVKVLDLGFQDCVVGQ